MKHLVLSLLVIVTATSRLNAAASCHSASALAAELAHVKLEAAASTLGNLDRLPEPVMSDVIQFCSPDMHQIRCVNTAGNRLVRNHVPAVLEAHPFMADKSEKIIAEYTRTVIATGKALKAVHIALRTSASDDDLIGVQSLLRAPFIHVNAQNVDGHTALHLAAEKGHAAIVTVLLADPRTNVNVRNVWGEIALHLAAQNGHATIVTALLAAGADVHAHNQWGYTALHLAAVNGHAAIVTALLAAGADVNAQEQSGNTSLAKAAFFNEAEIVALLLANPRTDVNAHNKRGETALHCAQSNHNVAIVAMIQAHLDKIDIERAADEPALPDLAPVGAAVVRVIDGHTGCDSCCTIS